ncbi:MAG: adenylate/guanylate cyclase domain-containing protein [Candidatus Rifleibacteriota bacterium]
MKSNSTKTFVFDLVRFFSGAVFIILPAVIVWISLFNFRQQLQDDKIATLKKQMQKDLLRFDQKTSFIANPIRDVALHFDATMKKNQSLTYLRDNDLLQSSLKDLLGNTTSKYGFPSEASAFFFTSTATAQINFKNDREVSRVSLSPITKLMFDINHNRFADKLESLKQLGINLKNDFAITLNPNFLNGTANNSCYMFLRENGKQKLLLIYRHHSFLLLTVLIDFTGLDEKHDAMLKIRNFQEKSSHIAFVPINGNPLKTILTPRSSKSFKVLKRILNQLNDIPNKLSWVLLENELFLVQPPSPQSDYRILLSSEISAPEPEYELQLLASLLTIVGLFFVKAFAESIFLRRHANISIKIFILSIFFIVSIMPLVSVIYLSNEFLVSNLKLEKNRVSNQLSQKLTSLDLQTLYNFKITVHHLKSLDSTEKFQHFCELPGEYDYNVLIKENLEKFFKLNGPRISETWIYDRNGNFNCFEFSSMQNRYVPAKNINPVIAEVLKPRFDEIFARLDLANQKIDNQELKINELKTEMIDDLFQNVFGHKSYYDTKKDIGLILELTTFNDKNFMLSVPLYEKGKLKFILTHVIDSMGLRHHFPEEQLDLNPAKPIFCLYGNSDFFFTRPRGMAEIAQSFPIHFETAKSSNSSKYRLEVQRPDLPGNPIILAQPAMHSDFIMVASDQTRDLATFKAELAKRISLLTTIVLFFMIILAFAVSNYFLTPVNQLIAATEAIIREEYHHRLNLNHPDEFAEMAQTFNHMARQLEEGKLLSSFVTASLEDDLENQNKLRKASRKEVAIIFSGITGFKKLTTSRSPLDLFEMMKTHLNLAANLAKQFDGEIDKMIEDKIMMVFEPGEKDDAALRAWRFAKEISSGFKKTGSGNLSIGLNHGVVVSGIMGSEKVRLAKTVVGDPVNLAARLSAIAEENSGGIIVSGNILKYLNTNAEVKKLEISTVKGKTQSVEIFAAI